MNPEELLAHADFVSSLARKLVLDENRAADLSQSAWVAALEHPPAAEKPLQAWLTKVMRNFAVTLHRRESRRRQWEQATARPESLPSAEEIVEKMEIRRLLIDAVLGLDEPYRSTLILRYYENLSTREIAMRKNLPLETVRTREKRGLERLRIQLDALHKGNRESWLSSLGALAGLELALPAAQSSMATTGILTMTTKKFLALMLTAAAMLLVGASLILWPDRREDADPDYAETTSVANPSPSETESPLVDSTNREPLLPEHEAARAPAFYRQSLGGFSGRVLEQDATPVPGLKVEVLGFTIDGLFQGMNALEEERPPALELLSLASRTAEDGTFLVEGVFPRAYYLLALDRGGERPTVRMIDALPNPGETRDLGDIMLRRPKTLTGRVRDERGKPLSGVRVRAAQVPPIIFSFGVQDVRPGSSLRFQGDPLFHKSCVFDFPPALFRLLEMLPIPETLSAGDGSFRLHGVPTGPVTVVADKPGYLSPWKGVVASSKKEEQEVGELTLSSGLTLRGWVLDARGDPVPDVEVRMGPSLWNQDWCVLTPPVTTDAQGAFKVRGFPSSTVCGVIRRHPGDAWKFVGPVHAEEEMIFRLPADTGLRVRVKDGKDAPVSSACIKIREQSLQNIMPSHVPITLNDRIEAEEAGWYRIHGLAPGRYEMLVQAEGYAPALESLKLGNDPLEKEVTLSPGHEVRIRIMDREASCPVEWADVFIRPGKKTGPSSMKSFKLNDMTFGSMKELEEYVKVHAADSSVIDWFKKSLSLVRGRTDQRGLALFPNLAPGRYWVSVSHPGYAVTTAAVEVPAKEACWIWMSKGGTLAGRILHEGSPHDPPFAVILEAEAGEALPDAWFPHCYLTDHEGAFLIKNLYPGEWDVHVMKRLFGRSPLELFHLFSDTPLVERKVAIVSGETRRIDLPLHGSVVDRSAVVLGCIAMNGAPVEEAWVEIRNKTQETTATLDPDGNYRFEKLTPGKAELIVQIPRGPGGEPAFSMRRNIRVEAGRFLREDFIFHTGSIFGSVTCPAQGRPAAGIKVEIASEAGGMDTASSSRVLSKPIRMSVVTGPDGSFRFERLPAGRYWVRARNEENTAEPARITDARKLDVLPGGTTGPIELTLLQGVAVQGRVDLSKVGDGACLLMLIVYPSEKVSFDDDQTMLMNADGSGINITMEGSHWVRVDRKTGDFCIPHIFPGPYQAMLLPAHSTDRLSLNQTQWVKGCFLPMAFQVPLEGLTDLVLTPEIEKPSKEDP